LGGFYLSPGSRRFQRVPNGSRFHGLELRTQNLLEPFGTNWNLFETLPPAFLVELVGQHHQLQAVRAYVGSVVTRHRALALTSAGGLVALVALVLLRGMGAEPVQVATAEVTTGPIARRIMVTGALQPTRTVAIGSQISGTIQSIESDFNDTPRHST
jgi:hypothetical protein